MQTIEFSYEDVNGRELNIMAYVENGQIYFKAFDGNKRVTTGSLTTLDVKNIEAFIKENAQDDVENESDFYERQND